MSQCQKKCDCELYDNMGDHRTALIKMELPEYDESYGGTSYTIYRAIRFIGYVVVLVLLSYSLWRIHVIESTLVASDRFANVSKIIAMGNSNALHRRVARSIKGTNSLVDQKNSFEFEKELTRSGMLTSKNETPMSPKKKLKSKEDFNTLVNALFNAIQRMHNDSDRSHFDRNMKMVFQAWFPVFDALLPSEFTENNDEEIRNTRSVDKSSQESSEENKKERFTRDVDKSSQESSEEKKKQRINRDVDKSSQESSEENKKQRITRDVDKSSQESSEEKKNEQNKPRQTRSLMSSSDESSEEQVDDKNEQKDVTTEIAKKQSDEKKVEDNKDEQKSSEESSEENNKNRRKRSSNTSSGESTESDSSESHEDKQMRQLQAELDRYNRINLFDKGYVSIISNYEQKSSESLESLESSEESSEKDENKNRYPNFYNRYNVVTARPYVKNDISYN